jgi:hypothetical protein
MALQLMRDFATRTGVRRDVAPKRYLWTDAYAVLNWLGFFVTRRDHEALLLARRLVEQTHRVLGRHRSDDPRRGWISGLGEEAGTQHPTVGGLRIGKALPERGVHEPLDPELEWERDGQYFHYLTKWMQCLGSMTKVTGDPSYQRWAVELARTALARFSAQPSAHWERGIYWKMSIDLGRPQVPSMGHHDPLDGLLTYQRLQADCGGQAACDLSAEIADLVRLCAGRSWETADPLGLGGLLCDAFRVARLEADGFKADRTLLVELLAASVRGLEAFTRERPFEHPAASRLAFREFGLSIGLHAARHLERVLGQGSDAVSNPECRQWVQLVLRYEPLGLEIETFWREPANRMSPGWQAHRDINDVMFATSLAPAGLLNLR